MVLGVVGNLGTELLDLYNSLISLFPQSFQLFVNLFLIVFLVFIYVLFIWKFYRSISTKNILELNLNQYNRYQHPFLAKALLVFFYFLEYIIILPFLIFFWFSFFTVFLIFLTENLDISSLLLISAVIITVIRLTAYYNEDLAKDVAKLIPFTLLAVSLLNPSFFSIERVFNQFSEISLLFDEIFVYLIFIIVVEMILRFFEFLFYLLGISGETSKEAGIKGIKKVKI